MSVFLIFAAVFFGLLIFGSGACWQEYEDTGEKGKRDIHAAFALIYTVACVSAAYWAGFWAPH